MKKPLEPTSRWNLFTGLLRLTNNQCPRCNSDAPLVDRCSVCNNIHHPLSGHLIPNKREEGLYPPTVSTKALWWYTWVHPFAKTKQKWMDEES